VVGAGNAGRAHADALKSLGIDVVGPLSGTATVADFEPLRDPSYFARVDVDAEAGTIAWPDGLDMAPEPLYAEALRHPVRPARAAR